MEWSSQVYRHGQLQQLDERMWSVRGSLPRSPLPRNMFVYRMDSGGLLIYSAVCLREEQMQMLETSGHPEIILVPGHMHRMQARAWSDRYPDARVLCPSAARDHVAKEVEVHGTVEAELGTLGVIHHACDGVKAREGVFEFPLANGKALIFCDTLMNLPHQKGVGGFLLRVLGSTGFFGVTRIGRMLVLEDRARFKRWLEHQGGREDLALIGVAHGNPILQDCADRLLQAAARL